MVRMGQNFCNIVEGYMKMPFTSVFNTNNVLSKVILKKAFVTDKQVFLYVK